jgi:hypothetical protein
MCTVNLKVNDAMVKRINPELTNRESINQWAQKLLDMVITNMAEAIEPDCDMSVEELYNAIEQDIKTDEAGRILLTDRMKEALRNAEQSLAEGSCLNKEQFHERFAKWL